eukprot:761195-Hanusia_phi.AAC.3
MNRSILKAISLGCALQSAASFVVPSSFVPVNYHPSTHSHKGLCNFPAVSNAKKCSISRQQTYCLTPRMSSGVSNTGSIPDFGESENKNVSPDLQKSSPTRKKSFLRVVWDFTRPHTIIGSILSVVSLHLFALTVPGLNAINLSNVMVALSWSLVSACLPIQIYDVDIDRINKPYLPIPSGELSLQTYALKAVLSVSLKVPQCKNHRIFLLPTALFYPFDKIPLLAGRIEVAWDPVTGGSCVLGTLYSMPPFRLKRFPLLAAICIIVVRGTLINLFFYAHTAAVRIYRLLADLFLQPFVESDVPDVNLVSSLYHCIVFYLHLRLHFIFVTNSSSASSPVSGDREFQVKTLSVRFGSRKVAAVWVQNSSRLLLQESEKDEEKTFSEKAYRYHRRLELSLWEILTLLASVTTWTFGSCSMYRIWFFPLLCKDENKVNVRTSDLWAEKFAVQKKFKD